MRRLKIGFDFDGVIANSHPLKSVIAKEVYGIEIPAENMSRELVIASGLLTREQYIDIGVRAMGGEYSIPVVECAPYYLKELRGHHDVSIVTSRSDKMLQAAQTWLAREGIEVPIQGVGYAVSKVDACRGLDLYVDDDLEKLEPLIGVVPNLLLFSWPWNLYEREHGGIQRIDSWWGIYNHIHYEM